MRFIKADKEEYRRQCVEVYKVLDEYLGHDLEQKTLQEIAQECVNSVYLSSNQAYGDGGLVNEEISD